MSNKETYKKTGLISVFLLLITVFTMQSATKKNMNSSKTPDFAFPETVSNNARTALDEALKSGNNIQALKAAMQLSVAQNLISNEKYKEELETFADLAEKLPEPYSQLALLLKAQVYADIYNESSWTYNNRAIPVSPVPENVMEWSRDIFSITIQKLVEEAFRSTTKAKEMSIRDIGEILENDYQARKLGMTVYDFMMIKGYELLSSFRDDSGEDIIPFGYASGNKKTEITAASLSEDLINEDIEWHESRNEAQLAAALSYFKYQRMPWRQRQDYAAQCMEKYIDTPYCAPFIIANNDIKDKYHFVESYLKKFPECGNAKALKALLTQLGQEKIILESISRIYPGEEGKAIVKFSGIYDFKMLVVKLPDLYLDKSIKLNSVAIAGKVVAAIPVHAEGVKPEEKEKTINIPALQSGVYVLVPSKTDKLKDLIREENQNSDIETFNVSRLAALRVTGDDKNNESRLYVVDGMNQSPISKAKVVLTSSRDKKTTTLITNADGFITLPSGSYNILISKGADRIKENVWNWGYGRSNNDNNYRSRVLTDLSIYHPGDDLQFVGILYEEKDREMHPIAEKEIRMMLMDANYQKVDTLTLTTDTFGRVSGKFTLPESGLLGRYVVRMMSRYNDNVEYGASSVSVAEYKSPTFYATCEGTEEEYKLGDIIKIKGKAMTYSGMPLSNAQVKFNVSYVSLWWCNDNVNANYGGETVTGADGSFTIELPTEGLRGTRYAFGGYKLDITVISPSGETQEIPAEYFSLGSAYNIMPTVPSEIEAVDTVGEYAVRVLDIVRNPVKKNVWYQIENMENGKVVMSGEFESPIFKLNTTKLPSGRYRIKFSLSEDMKATDNQQNAETETVIYRKNDKETPYHTPLWIPEKEIIVGSGEKDIKVKVGSAYADSWLLMQVSDCDKVIERRWVKVNAGMTDVEVVAPAINNRVSVTFSGLHDFEQKIGRVTLIPAIQRESVKIKAETFRDRVTPGMQESWRFNFTLDNKVLAGIPVSAVMSNKALNAIAPFSWMFDPAGNIGYTTVGNMQWLSSYSDGSWRINMTKTSYEGVRTITCPSWKLYGLSLYGADRRLGRVYIRGVRNQMADGAVEELNSVEVTEMKMAAPMMAAKAESVEYGATESADEAMAGQSSQNEEETKQDVQLREIECPLAFFMPMLMTDEHGDALVNFTVPQFNGTWQFQIMGYTMDMKGAVGVWDAVASKPVMVQMNAPRFVRTGDEVSIAAMLFNNDTKVLKLRGKIEIFNPATGEILAQYNSRPTAGLETDPTGSQKISMLYRVPSEINYLGVRVYAISEDFSDGEQTILPVYPSSTPVLESKTFYIAPGSEGYSMKLPTTKKGAVVTLQYCDNPIWEVVTALPEISNPESSNILSQVYSLYGNAIGAGLAKDYPEIVDAIKIFSNPANSADSTLVSNLEKNASLKTVALNNTPWVRSAASETMRMQSLEKYTDKKRSEEIIAATIKEIGKLQNPDGGWSWCSNMKSSGFITGRVLLHLAMLKDMNYLPSDAESMAIKAVKYADECCVKELKEYKGKEFPYISMLNYLYVRSNFKDVAKSSAFAAMAKKGLEAVKNGWKGMDIYEKATAATLLSREGYNMEARTILESLRQYATVTEEKGMWFDNLSSSFFGWNKLITTAQVLEAYSEIEPQSRNIDKLRQWLLITKQAENWGDDRETAEVIHAILSSGTKWTIPSESPKIFIGDTQVIPDRVAKLTGNLTVSLTGGKGELKIKRTGAGPAWGGVISQYVAPIKDVKSDKTPELSIEKAVYVISNDADGTTATAGDLKVGDKVRVTLTLTCDRDIEYVAVMDSRAACLEPADQLSGYFVSDGVWMYKEVRDNSTNLFIPFLAKGTHVISYECYVDRAGEYSLGIASAQSQYAPAIAAHSSGQIIEINQDAS